MSVSVVFFHHCCPDGGASADMLRLYYSDHAIYEGLNHNDNLDEMFTEIESKIRPETRDLVFADISLDPDLYIRLLEKYPLLTIKSIDHHESQIKKIDDNYLKLEEHIRNKRLFFTFNIKKSATQLCWDFACGLNVPVPFAQKLIGTVDLITSTGNLSYADELNTLELDDELHALIATLKHNEKLADYPKVKAYMQYLALAVKMDNLLQTIPTSNGSNAYLTALSQAIATVNEQRYADFLRQDKQALIEQVNKQIVTQQAALANARLVQSPIADNLFILHVDAAIETGRTFDLLIEADIERYRQQLIGQGTPNPEIIAMVTQHGSLKETNNWVAMRHNASASQLNLFVFAALCNRLGLSGHSGGHRHATALQLSREQFLQYFLNPEQLSEDQKNRMTVLSKNSQIKQLKDELYLDYHPKNMVEDSNGYLSLVLDEPNWRHSGEEWSDIDIESALRNNSLFTPHNNVEEYDNVETVTSNCCCRIS